MGVFLCPVNLSWLLFIVLCNQKGNQVPIYNKSFGDFIDSISANKGSSIRGWFGAGTPSCKCHEMSSKKKVRGGVG